MPQRRRRGNATNGPKEHPARKDYPGGEVLIAVDVTLAATETMLSWMGLERSKSGLNPHILRIIA